MGQRSKEPERPGADARNSYPAVLGGNAQAGAAGVNSGDSWQGLTRVGLYGGSFDPVHKGHLHVANSAQAARGLERVVFMPAAQPPHKPGQRLAGGDDRLAMLAVALRGRPDWVVDRLELDRPGPSYTVDTLRQLRSHLGLDPRTQLFLVIGSDNLAGLPGWKGIREVLSLAEPLIVARERDLSACLERLGRELEPEWMRRIESGLVAEAPVEVSSSALRERAARGQLVPGDLPPGVWEYIVARGIYGTRRPGA